jgi:spermidine/putrescine transport system ATP-binding protein
MSYLRLEGLTRRFGAAAGVFDLSLSLERGAMLALLGPSGSGKTTTLRLLGGFETPDAGRILIEDEDVTGLAPARRRFGMVFQHYALFPHLDVGQNIAFGLESLGVAGAPLAERVARALTLVDLGGYERRRVGELSGGQQQRVALARALAPEPRVLLLDEPLSNLDPALRERTRGELRALIRRVGITTVLVTHEQEDAFDLGDLVAVLRSGRLEQCAAPETLYRLPATEFVAGFIGRSSTLTAEVVHPGPPAAVIRVGDAEWRVPGLWRGGRGPVRLVARPEAVGFVSGAGLAGTVTDRRFLGAGALFRVATSAGSLEVSALPEAAVVGAPVTLGPAGPGLHLFPAEAP